MNAGSRRQDDLDPACLERLLRLLGENLVQVIATMKVVEDEAVHTSVDARDRLVKSLVDMGTLVQKAPSLDAEMQASYIGRVERSLREAMITPASEVVAARLIAIDKLWDEYERVTSAARADGSWTGDPPHDELEAARYRIAKLTGDAQETAGAGVPWDEWVEAVSKMVEAASLAGQLRQSLSSSIKEANAAAQDRERDVVAKIRDRRAMMIGVAGILLGVLGIAVGVVIAVL